MPSTNPKAHYQGRSIPSDEPYEVPPNARLLVTRVAAALDAERDLWASLAGEDLARAYGDNEPDYALDDVRRP